MVDYDKMAGTLLEIKYLKRLLYVVLVAFLLAIFSFAYAHDQVQGEIDEFKEQAIERELGYEDPETGEWEWRNK